MSELKCQDCKKDTVFVYAMQKCSTCSNEYFTDKLSKAQREAVRELLALLSHQVYEVIIHGQQDLVTERHIEGVRQKLGLNDE